MILRSFIIICVKTKWDRNNFLWWWIKQGESCSKISGLCPFVYACGRVPAFLASDRETRIWNPWRTSTAHWYLLVCADEQKARHPESIHGGGGLQIVRCVRILTDFLVFFSEEMMSVSVKLEPGEAPRPPCSRRGRNQTTNANLASSQVPSSDTEYKHIINI